MTHRRSFLTSATGAGALTALGNLGFLGRLPSVSAAEATMPPHLVRFHPGIEPLVRLLDDTPRERVLEEVAARVRCAAGMQVDRLVAAAVAA